MRRKTIIAISTCCIMAACSLVPAIAGNKHFRSRAGNSDGSAILTQEEIDDLMFMREEEKLARDVYLTQYVNWGTFIFYNISLSEQSHTDAVRNLIEKYWLEDPAIDEIGLFANTELQLLYDQLTTRAEDSELEALMVGANIEELDIEDLVNARDRTDRSDIRRVYGNLLNGSTNHLIAYVAVIENMTGELYVAQYLPQEVVDEILGR